MEDKTMMKYFNTTNMMTMLPNIAKVLVLVSIMVLSMAAFIANINAAKASSPILQVTITGEHITLGDVFTDIEDNADFVLAPAPRPGITLTWDARTINRVAKAFDLSWNANLGDTIQIRRLANIITSDMIKKAIKSSLADKGAGNDIELEFLNAASSEIILPHDIEPSITVVSSSYNASRQTFSASLQTPNDKVTDFTGVTHAMVDLPVLKIGARRGETIGQNDIVMLPVRADFVTDAMIVSKSEIVGMTPRKIIRGNAPIARNDLDKPVMVQRGELVTMNLNSGAIKITALAKALEAGTKGDIIRLMNIDSKRTIEAKITGTRTATVLF
jgi:flagella basal body P-ring formation protein FlgA